MFDTYHRTINRGPDHVSVSVTEKRAPTDQSVALLKEMEKAAEEKWKGGIRLEGCPFDAIVHHHRDYMTADYKFIVIYKLRSQRRPRPGGSCIPLRSGMSNSSASSLGWKNCRAVMLSARAARTLTRRNSRPSAIRWKPTRLPSLA